MLIHGQLMALSNFSKGVCNNHHLFVEQQKNYSKYFHYGQQVCPFTFLFLHNIGEKRLKNLIKHFKNNGFTPRIHGNTKCLPKHALSFTTIECVVRFLVDYADQNGILLPERIPGYRKADLKLLPSSVSKRVFGRCTRNQLSQEITLVLLHIPHFVNSGILCSHLSS